MVNLVSKYKPTKEQPDAIKKLVDKLYSKFKDLFLNNHVKNFASYYDIYQNYILSSDS